MSVATELLLYVEDGVQFQEKVESLIVDADIMFKKVLNISQIFSALETTGARGVVLLSSQEMLGTISRVVKSNPSYANKIFAIHCLHNLSNLSFDNICEDVDLDKFNKFLNMPLSKRDYDGYKDLDLLYKLIRYELERLEVSKKYIGYKYLVDIIYKVIINEINDCYNLQLFEDVARQNLCGAELVERDIRHMLVTMWNNNLKFQKELVLNSKNINSKNILNSLIKYIKNNI